MQSKKASKRCDVVISFIKNTHRLEFIKGRKWRALEENRAVAIANALKFSPKQAATHLGFSALEGVLSKKAYSLLLHNQQQPPQISVEELETEAWALLPPGTPLPDPKWNDVAGELARAPTADLPNTAALLGGLVAQEVIKMITKQYVPIDGCCVVCVMLQDVPSKGLDNNNERFMYPLFRKRLQASRMPDHAFDLGNGMAKKLLSPIDGPIINFGGNSKSGPSLTFCRTCLVEDS